MVFGPNDSGLNLLLRHPLTPLVAVYDAGLNPLMPRPAVSQLLCPGLKAGVESRCLYLGF